MSHDEIEYRSTGALLRAHVEWEEGHHERRPAVLVCHAFAGQGDFERARAEDLAKLGYVGVALDVYGKGVLATDPEESRALMAPLLKDRAALGERLLAGVEAARTHPRVDPDRVAAIGFCFGGLCALDLARRNAPVRGVVSFHGLFHPLPEPAAEMQPKVLVLHGHDDPMATPEAALALQTELTQAKADWQMHVYGGTMHAFTNPKANDAQRGTVHQPAAASRSWRSMQAFLEELFD